MLPSPKEAIRAADPRLGSARRAISTRQAQVAALVAHGKSNREIARALRLSPRTVDAHLAALFTRLNVRSRSELIATLFFSAGEDRAVTPAPKTNSDPPASPASRSTLLPLSARQTEIARLVARGESNREIACALRLSPRTIEAHLAALFNRLNVSSRSELTAALSFSEARRRVLRISEAPADPRVPQPAHATCCALATASARQIQVAALVALGESNSEIGARLWLSSRTVEAHVIALCNKLNVDSRGELIAALACGHFQPHHWKIVDESVAGREPIGTANRAKIPSLS